MWKMNPGKTVSNIFPPAVLKSNFDMTWLYLVYILIYKNVQF